MKKKEEEAIWKWLFDLLLVQKKYVPRIIVCLLIIALITFAQPLLVKQIMDKGMLKNDINSCHIFLYISNYRFGTICF